MKQERRADQHDGDELLGELFPQVIDRALDQARAVVGHHDLDALGQAVAEVVQLGLDGFDGAERVLAPAQDHDTACRLALAVEIADAAPHLRPAADIRDV